MLIALTWALILGMEVMLLEKQYVALFIIFVLIQKEPVQKLATIQRLQQRLF